MRRLTAIAVVAAAVSACGAGSASPPKLTWKVDGDPFRLTIVRGGKTLVEQDAKARFRYQLAGTGEPQVTVHAPRFELLRATTGRRTEEEIASYEWDPAPDATFLIAAPFFTIRTESLAE